MSDDSAHLGDATGYDEEGTYANVDGEGRYAREAYRLRWQVENLGLDSRFVSAEGGRQGTYDFNLAWREIPRRQFITTSTVFAESSAGTLVLPGSWVRAPLTSGFTALDSTLVPRAIASDRSVLDIGGRYRPTSKLRFSAALRQQQQDGLKLQGGSSFTNASILPMPFDYSTDEVDLGVRYGGENGFLSLAWYLSDFENSNSALRWEQPFSVSPGLGTDTFAQAQAPDSQLQQISIAGGYFFAAYRTVVTASVSMGTIDQDTMFLPYTTNTNLSPPSLPRASLGGDVETSNISFAISSRPLRNLRLKLGYRQNERNNKTAQDAWERVIVDAVLSGEARLNTPYSFERQSLRLSADYDFDRKIRISGGYERDEIDRDFQEVTSQVEDTGWGRLRWRPLASVELSARGGVSKRDPDNYDEAYAVLLGQNPLLRKYNLAYRYQQFGDLRLSWSPAAAPVTVGLNALYSEDDYNQSVLGIVSGETLSVALDASWSISENAMLYVNTGVENVQSEQVGSGQFGLADWRALHDDSFTTIGAGIRIRQIADRVRLQMDYNRSDGSSEIELMSAAGPDPFPDLNSVFDDLRLKVTYARSERLEFDFSLRYQRFDTDDWSLQGVQPATIPSVLSLGASPYDEDVLIVGLGFRFMPGRGAAPPAN